MHDDALGALLHVVLVGLLASVPWALFGGAVARLAAVELAAGRREAPRDALAFARRHLRGFLGAKAALLLAVAVPVGLAFLVAMLGRLGGPLAPLFSSVAVAAVPALAMAAVVVGSLAALASWLTGPTIATEDSDAFDAVSRVFTYVAAGLPRLLGVRLLFLGGALLGALWRALRTGLALGLTGVALQVGAGRERVDGWLSALSGLVGHGGGAPAPVADLLPALLLAAVVAGIAALWLADLACRVVCARVGAFLHLREAVDRVPADRLRTAPAGPAFLDAEAAGFVEVTRIGVPTKRPSR